MLDLFNGAAGAAYFLTLLAQATGEEAYLRQACAAGDALVRAAQPAPGGAPGCFWQVPLPGSLARSLPYLGLLHGAAGIGLALHVLARASGEERFRVTAGRAADFLLSQAIRMPDGGWRWPRFLGDPDAALQAHCHGAGGIGQFFLRLARDVNDARYVSAASGAAKTVASEGRSTSDLCHGVAGDVAFFLDHYRATGERGHLEAARRAGQRLAGFQVSGQEGAYHTKRGSLIAPGLMTGYAGVGSIHLRLAHPESGQDPIVL
jgi:lantibiotic modifying enzyme